MRATDPAFPEPTSNPDLLPGLSIRAYFAAHAPAEPAEWFKPTVPPKPKDAPYFFAIDDVLRSLVDDDMGIDRDRVKNVLLSIARGPDDEGVDVEAGVLFLRRETGVTISAGQETQIRALVPKMALWSKARDAAFNAHREWDYACQVQRSAQWPWAYADAVLAAGGGL